MGKKKVSVANFNVVFIDGSEEKPLLSYFDTILMPALTSGIKRTSGDSTYLFLNVFIHEDKEKGYVLLGNIVKSTVLDVLSNIDDEGKLIELDNHYPTAPYSTFAIYLKNHRMVFAENQKGSPSLKSFRATVKCVMDRYVRDENARRHIDNKKELPIPMVGVVGIPSRENLQKVLSEVSAINKLRFKFYPLNGDGDIEFADMFTMMTGKMRQRIDSKTGDMSFNSPRNIPGVIELVQQAEGIVEPIFEVTYPDKTQTTIKNDMLSERRKIEIEGDDLEDEMINLVEKGYEIKSIKHISSENDKIYQKSQNKIIPFVKR